MTRPVRRVARVLAVLAPGCGAAQHTATAPKPVHGVYPAGDTRLFLDCRGAGGRTVRPRHGTDAVGAAIRDVVSG